MYDELVSKLQAIEGVRFAEYEWRTRPDGNHGTVKPDFDAEADNGDDHKQDRAVEGSIDLYTHGKEMIVAAAVESVLEEVCEGSWELNSIQYERETGLLHREYIFQLEKW
jgi:hypothetical protein